MGDFKSQLDGELEKRGLTKKDAEQKNNSKAKTKKPKKNKRENNKTKKVKNKNSSLPFSFFSFFIALILGLVALAILIGFLFLNAEKTAADLEERLPTKTAIVNKEININIEDVQPVLRMQPVISNEEEADKTAEIISEKQTPAENKKISEDKVMEVQISLLQNTDYGMLPRINKENGMTAFKAYKRPSPLNNDKPSIAFILTDMGINTQQTTALINNLPKTITLAFSPYASNIKTLMMQAREEKHETWMTFPLQTNKFPLQDPGPLAILNAANIRQNQQRLNFVMGKATGYTGFITQKDHIFRSEDARTNPIFKEVFDRGLAMIDTNNNSINFVERLGEREGRPYGQANFWLDDELTPLALNQRLRQALDFSRNTGGAIIMLRPYPASIKTLNKFLNSVAAQDFNVVPASALVKNNE